MNNREYQYGFSKKHADSMYNRKKRTKKAKKVIAVLKDYNEENQKDLSSLKLLDIGCSTGIMSSYYGNFFQEVVGIDIDKSAIQYASDKNSSENIKYQVKDSLNTGFPDESFDVISCTHIYEHVPDANELVKEMKRLLRPGGLFILQQVIESN